MFWVAVIWLGAVTGAVDRQPDRPETGEDLLRQCESSEGCAQSVRGFNHGLQVQGDRTVCVPVPRFPGGSPADYEPVASALVAYLRAHRDQLHRERGVMLLEALRRTYPCRSD